MKWNTKLEEIAAPTKYPIGDGDHGAIKPEMYQAEGVPYIRVADIKWDGRIDRSKMVYISEEVNSVNPKSFLYPGDIIISKTGATIGKIAIIPEDFPISNTTASIGKVSLDFSKVNSRFVFWCMKSRNFQEQMWSVSHKSAQPGFNVQDLKKFKIPLPPISQQEKIAKILDVANDLNHNAKELLGKYNQLTQAIFLDMFGDPLSNSKGWEIKPFEYFAKFDTKMTSDFEKYAEYPHIGIANIEKDTGKIIGYKKVKDENLTSGKYIFTDKHIIYSKIRPNLNKVALPDFDGLCSADSYPLLVYEKVTNRQFFAFLLRTESFLEFILKHSTRTNIPKANKAQMKLFKGIAPPLSLQNQFTDRVALLEEQKAIVQKSLQKSEELFSSLLQKAFKGELL